MVSRHFQNVQPSRVLNDQRRIFGLGLNDFAAAIVIFMGGSWVFEGSGYELLSIPAAVLFLVILSPVRLSTRRKVIRDWGHKLLTKKVLYDPRATKSS